jgi:hypothetical protein
MDEGENALMYPLRGIKEQGKWTLAAVTYDDVEALKTDFFFLAYELYTNYSLFGNAGGGGWANERRTVLEIIKIFKAEENGFDAWEMEKRNKK